ncbi:MAG: hypothetical protein ACI4EV_04760 [Lachnospiraceae bacterium]
MYTSVINVDLAKAAAGYGIVSALVAAFGAVYEHFSFGVYSNSMIYAFSVTFFACIMCLLLLRSKKEVRVCRLSLSLWNISLAVLTVGMIVKGILDIYGIEHELVIFYPIAGVLLIIISFFLDIAVKKVSKINKIK